MIKKARISKLLLLFFIFSLLFTVGCQGNQNIKDQSNVQSSMKMESRSNGLANPEVSKKSAVQSSDYNKQEAVDRKIIKEANLKIITKDLKNIEKEVTDIINNYDGYLADSNQWQSNRKYYRFTIKIPQKHFQSVVNKLEKIGSINNKQISSRDITRQYIDLKARLKNFKAQEKRYLSLLDQAKEVEDILKIEKELNRVRRNIEQLQGQLNYYNNKISFSTINATFTEPKPVINNNSWGIIDSFKQSIQEFIDSINSIIIIIGALLPWLALILLISAVIYKIYQQRNKK